MPAKKRDVYLTIVIIVGVSLVSILIAFAFLLTRGGTMCGSPRDCISSGGTCSNSTICPEGSVSIISRCYDARGFSDTRLCCKRLE